MREVRGNYLLDKGFKKTPFIKFHQAHGSSDDTGLLRELPSTSNALALGL